MKTTKTKNNDRDTVLKILLFIFPIWGSFLFGYINTRADRFEEPNENLQAFEFIIFSLLFIAGPWVIFKSTLKIYWKILFCLLYYLVMGITSFYIFYFWSVAVYGYHN